MKVLYIAHYKEASGWGQVSRDNIMALDTVGVDVVPRAITLGNPTADIPDRIKQLEHNSAEGCDIVIQHVLPHYMKYDAHFRKNIGIYELETTNIQLTSWAGHLNLMTELWLPCTSMIKDCPRNGIVTPTKHVPHTFDTSIYKKDYSRLNLPTQNRFTFYFIGEMNQRKHLSALIQAFHIEFQPHEPVELVIKVNKFGMSPEQLAQELQGFCNSIKENLRLYKDPNRYKPEIIITVNVSREDLLRLHRTCDCFVLPSYGEAWGVPAWEAMAMGNLVIASATGAMLDYIDSERNGFLVGGTMEPVFGQHETFEEFGTSRELWFNISVLQLMRTMRRVYAMDKEKQNTVRASAKLSAGKYDYVVVGQQMKELLQIN